MVTWVAFHEKNKRLIFIIRSRVCEIYSSAMVLFFPQQMFLVAVWGGGEICCQLCSTTKICSLSFAMLHGSFEGGNQAVWSSVPTV